MGLRGNHPPVGSARTCRGNRQRCWRRKNALAKSSTAPMRSSDNVRFHRWPTNRVWTRDSGCTFVTTASFARPERRGRLSRVLRELAAVKWRFNAWAKYLELSEHDEKIGSLMAKAASARELRPIFGKQRVVLEGGSIDVNGQGHFAHDRGVPAQQSPAAQSNDETRRLRKGLCGLSGNQERDLAGLRHKPATTLTATSTTSLVSSLPTRS